MTKTEVLEEKKCRYKCLSWSEVQLVCVYKGRRLWYVCVCSAV